MSRLLPLLSLPLLACGMKVNINGKTRTIGGSDPQPQAQQQQAAPATQSAVATATPAAATAPSAPTFKTVALAVNAPLTSTPVLADVGNVTLETTVSKIGADSDCGQYTTTAPVAVIDIQKPSANMNVSLHGVSNDGFVMKHDKLYWSVCTGTISEVPTMHAPKEGWQPGRYEIYPVARYADKKKAYQLEVALFDPKNAAMWSDKVRALKIEQKQAKPMFVEVALRPDRQVRREGLSGSRCGKIALAFEPDIALSIARPIPGLVIRPMPSRTPVTLRIEHKDKDRESRYCVEARDGRDSSSHGPTWQAASEIHFGNEEEGLYGISVGLPAGASDEKVTLMIYDASTTFDPLAVRPMLDGPVDLEHRELAWHFPQLNVDELRLDTYAHAELVANVWAAAPSDIFVYPDLDLDKDIAQGSGWNTVVFPKKNEPLIVLDAGAQHTRVMAQDGFTFSIKNTHLALKPEGAVAPLAAPHPFPKTEHNIAVESLLPPTEKKLIAAGDAMRKQHDACVDRVAAPYERQLPTIVRPSNVDVVYVETPRTRAINEAMDRAIIKTCGSREQFDKKLEAHRQKELVAVEKARTSLFATSKRSW